ncbi:hypothetical protein [Actinomadura rifamycini]|uniref:hypothetical protein n=1 Tax=Actinomadura rifamycini TaxID=31962 RepID=UPI0004195428|nr:hypothetical protein [Actinomadura rifamycini]
MSTRNLGLLTSTAVAAFALGGFAAAALGDAPATLGADTVPAAAVAAPNPPVVPAPPAPPEPPPGPKSAAKPAKAAAADGRDLAACTDGKCEVIVQDGDVIKLDDRFRMGPIGVGIDGGLVTFTRQDDGTRATTTIMTGITSTQIHWSGLTLRPRMTEEGELVLKLRHRDAGKLAEKKPAADKPADAKPAEQKPAEDKPADTKPADTEPAEDKPANRQ